jgi:site-specific DNA-methyltransferase (adenine-specific)
MCARRAATTHGATTPDIQHAVIPLEALAPHPRNYRQHPEQQIARLAASLARFGQVRSIVVQQGAPGGHYLIVAGHGLVEAARQQGYAELRADVIPATWTPEQVEGYLIADNQHAAGAVDDLVTLAEMLEAQYAADYDLEAVGSSREDLDALLESLAQAHLANGEEQDTRDVDDPDGGGDDFDTTPDESGPTRCQPGDLWQLGDHRLLCGDSTKREDVARLMDGERADMMWTDPPYGVSYVGKTKRSLTIENDDAQGLDGLLKRAFASADDVALMDGAAIYIAHPPGALSVTFADRFVAQGWRFHERLIWVKDSMVLGHSDYHLKHEDIIFGYKRGVGRRGRGGEGWYGDNAQTSVFEVPRPKRSEEHPTMKPVALIAAMVENSSPNDGRIYEPFCGSGSTLIAAERLTRRCYAIELDPHYCDVILRRWEAETGREATLLSRIAEGVSA